MSREKYPFTSISAAKGLEAQNEGDGKWSRARGQDRDVSCSRIFHRSGERKVTRVFRDQRNRCGKPQRILRVAAGIAGARGRLERNAIDARRGRGSESPQNVGFRTAGFELLYYPGPRPVPRPRTWQVVSARSLILNGLQACELRDELLGIAGQTAARASEAGQATRA